MHIANKIIEALPHPEFSDKFEDVKPGHKYYNDIEFVLINGIMSATSETTFSPDAPLTNGQLNQALNVINGTDNTTDDNAEVSAIKLAFTFISNGSKSGFAGIVDSISLMFKVLSAHGFNPMATVTRAEAASYFKAFAE